MNGLTRNANLLAGVLCLAATLSGCSQFMTPEIEAAPQVLNEPFDKAVDAARQGDLAYIKSCVESDPRYIDAFDGAGRTLLHYAAERGDKDIVAYLLEQGAYILAEDDDGYTALDISLQAVAPQGVIDILREATIRASTAQ